MTPTQTLVSQLVIHGGAAFVFLGLWVMERRWRRAAERREKAEFDARLELVVEKSTEIGTLRKRIDELEEALRGHPYSSRNAAPPTTRPEGYGFRRPLPPPMAPPPPPTARIDY